MRQPVRLSRSGRRVRRWFTRRRWQPGCCCVVARWKPVRGKRCRSPRRPRPEVNSRMKRATIREEFGSPPANTITRLPSVHSWVAWVASAVLRSLPVAIPPKGRQLRPLPAITQARNTFAISRRARVGTENRAGSPGSGDVPSLPALPWPHRASVLPLYSVTIVTSRLWQATVWTLEGQPPQYRVRQRSGGQRADPERSRRGHRRTRGVLIRSRNATGRAKSAPATPRPRPPCAARGRGSPRGVADPRASAGRSSSRSRRSSARGRSPLGGELADGRRLALAVAVEGDLAGVLAVLDDHAGGRSRGSAPRARAIGSTTSAPDADR